ncbi:MAG: TAXI family TRAP transporter solute-binding subunit [Gemmatimonas sp.]
MSSVSIATSDVDSTFHRQAVALGEMWKEQGLVDSVEPLFTSGSVENAQLVAAHNATYAFMAANWLPLAATGTAPFTAALPVRLLTPINTGPLFFVARADSKLETFHDLKGKRVGLGHENSGMVQHIHTIFRALGLSLDWFEPVYSHTRPGNQMLAQGEIDAQWQPPIPNVQFSELNARTALKVLSFSPEDRKAIIDKVPYYAEATIPKGAVRGHDRDSTEVAVINVLAVHADDDEDTVFRRTRAIIAGAGDLARRNPLYNGLDRLLRDAGQRVIPVLAKAGALQHPGAARAFREAGLSR